MNNGLPNIITIYRDKDEGLLSYHRSSDNQSFPLHLFQDNLFKIHESFPFELVNGIANEYDIYKIPTKNNIPTYQLKEKQKTIAVGRSGNSRGAQGNQGAQGAGGGAQGAQGAQGFQGAIGAQGNQGFQGDTGAQGTQGSQGSQGSTGAQGNQGFQGVTGAQGNQGFQGSTGAQGNQGFQGVTGAQGSQGSQGSTGAQGNQGFQGATGAQGNQGFQGTTGAQGAQGSQGSQGAQGAQGGSSGTFTPTTTAGANIDATAGQPSRWIQIGNEVFVSGQFTADATVATTATTITMSVPVATANFAALSNAGGDFSSNQNTGASGRITATVGAQTVTLSWTPTVIVNTTYGFDYSYSIQ